MNDQHGHAIGDLVLIKITELIKANIREIDLLARCRGDELIIILPNTTLDAGKIFAEK